MSTMTTATLLLLGLGATLASHEESTVTECHGSGTSNPSKLMWKMMQTLEERIKHPTLITYRSVGSSTGQYEFIGANNNYVSYSDFGAGDIPFSTANYAEALKGGVTMQIPFVLGAISFFFNIPGVESEHLFLTGCTLSGIFQRNITMWDHPDILAAGQNNLIASTLKDQPITVYRRVLGSSSTSSITQYLHEVTVNDNSCPYKWTIGVGKGDADDNNKPTAAPFWPDSTTPARTSDGVSDGIKATAFSIGYIDSGHGHQLGLKEIELRNADGVYLSSRQATIGAAADANPSPLPAATGSWANMQLINRAGAATWPVTAMSYMYIRQNQTGKGQTGALVKALATFALSDEGQQMAMETQFGFAPLSTTVKDIGLAGISSMVLDAGVTEYQFETSTAKGTGMGPYYISSNRKQFSSYELGEHESAIIALQASDTAKQATIDVLSAQVTALASEVASLTSELAAKSDDISDNDDGVTTATGLAAFATVWSVLVSIVLGVKVCNGPSSIVEAAPKTRVQPTVGAQM